MSTIFASKSVGEHLIRGVIGAGAAVAALRLLSEPSWISLAAALGIGGLALFAFRGCPMCWTIGLINTVFRAKSCKACEDISQR
jgi:hypothetical protein